jgi:hypothetical protein
VERSPNASLEVGAAVGANFELEEEPAAVLESSDEIESRLGIIARAIELVQIDSGATARIEGSLTAPAREFPLELEIESGERDLIPEPDLDVRLEDEPFH